MLAISNCTHRVVEQTCVCYSASAISQSTVPSTVLLVRRRWTAAAFVKHWIAVHRVIVNILPNSRWVQVGEVTRC